MEPSTRQYLAQLLMGAGQGITQASQGRPAGMPGPSFAGMLGGASTGIAAQMQRYKQEQLMAENAKREQDRFEQRLALQQQGLDQTGAYNDARIVGAEAKRKATKAYRDAAAAEQKRQFNATLDQRREIANAKLRKEPGSDKWVWVKGPNGTQMMLASEAAATGASKAPTGKGLRVVIPPKATAGYQLTPNYGDDGQVESYNEKLIPDGSADRKLGAIGAKFKRQLSESNASLRRMTAGVERAKQNVSKWTAGWGGLLDILPASQARELKGTITELASAGGLKALDGLRQASPGGGAVGNVSNFEQEILQSIFGIIDQKTSPERLLQALDRFQKNIIDAHRKTQADFDIDARAGLFGTALQGQYGAVPAGTSAVLPGGFTPANGWKVERQ